MLDQLSSPGKKAGIRKMKGCNKRRFSDDQIRSLESIFENESTKLEPRKKAQLAGELGLQPRQVAIWFQNKRARWKSKQLERDYSVLRNNYNALALKLDALKKEKHSLLLQVQKLKEMVGPAQEGSQCDASGGDVTTTDDGGKKKVEEKPRLAVEEGSEYGVGMLSDEGCSDQNTDYFAVDEGAAELLAMVEPACSSMTSEEDWHGLQSDGLFDHSATSCEWWDFWS